MRQASRLGPRLLLALRRPGDRRHDEEGRCSVCGAQTRFVFNSWIVPHGMAKELGERLAQTFAARESLFCRHCLASLRVRRIADLLLEHYAERAASIAELVEEPAFRALEIAEINSIGAMHRYLAAHPRLRYSEYPDEDVCALSYGDATLDLVLSSDTLEHVPDYRQALRETRRVLRPGGRHILTVPAVPSRRASFSREGLPRLYHGRGSGPYRLVPSQSDLVTQTEFGMDLQDALASAGFVPHLRFYAASDPDSDAALVFDGQAAAFGESDSATSSDSQEL